MYQSLVHYLFTFHSLHTPIITVLLKILSDLFQNPDIPVSFFSILM